MKHAFILLLLGITALVAQDDDPSAPPPVNELLIVVGAEGEEEYGQAFMDNLAQWKVAAARGKAKAAVIDAYDENSLASIKTYFKESPKDLAVPLWVILIGHGTYNRRQAYFNLAGPDLSAKDLKEWLKPFKRPLIVVNTASSSGAFLPILSEKNRITVTATKSGTEVNYASFGNYMADALLNPETDFNNDGENSVFEVFQYAARQTAEYYEQEGRIQTETPLLDDNGDGRGTSLKDYDAIREGGTSKREPDGSFAKRWALVLSPEEQAIPPEVRQRRNVLEAQIDNLRNRRHQLEKEEYYAELEGLALQIADLYTALEPEEENPVVETEQVSAPEETDIETPGELEPAKDAEDEQNDRETGSELVPAEGTDDKSKDETATDSGNDEVGAPSGD